MDDNIGGGQVEARTARPQRDEKDIRLALIEPAHLLGAHRLGGRALQGEVAHPGFVQPLCQQFQHGGELAEQQNAVPARHCLGDKLQTGVQLGAAARPVVCHKARVAADLPQPHQHGKHGHLVLRLCRPQLFAGVHHRCQIQLALLGLQLNAAHILRFGRQLPQYLGLHAPQDEGAGELVQPPHGVGILVLHDGLFKPGAEGLVGGQIPRHQKGEDAPQLAQAVFHRGAGQGKAHPAVHPAHRLVFLGGVVLDGLRFVQYAGVKALSGIQFFVPAQQIVAGDDDIRLCPPIDQRGAVGGIAVHGNTLQLRGELLAFLLPVQHQRRRADDKAGQLLPALLHGQQIAEHLHGLAQTHIIGQNAAHAVAIQCAQPAVAVPLVFAQGLLQRERRGILAVPHGVEAAADAAESIIPVEPQTVLPRKRPVQRRGTVERQGGVAVLQLCTGKLQCVVQLVQPFQTVIQPQQTAVPQTVVALFLVQGLQKLPQFLHRERAGVHFQVQHTAVHRCPHRDLRRGGL